MKVSPSISNRELKPLQPFEVNQAVIALELGGIDDALLDYVDFLASYIPIGAAYFIHILPKFDLYNALYEREKESLISNYELDQEVVERMRVSIKDRLTMLEANQVNFDVREGDALEELLKDTRDLGADLVIIGQKSGKEHHGILARNLARKASCNALIVPQSARRRIRKILVPIDFSHNSVQALRTALSIKEQLEEEVRLICLNIYDLPNFSLYSVQKSREEIKEMMEEDRREAFQSFLHTYAPEAEESIEIALIERKQPGVASYILEQAEQYEADLIVMGARGHSKVELLLLGSVTEKLLSANERIPTLVVKDR